MGGADFVFYLICFLYGTAIGMTNSHIIATLGSNYLKTNSFPESSSLFSMHPSLSLFFKKIISAGEKYKLPVVPPAVFVRRLYTLFRWTSRGITFACVTQSVPF